MFKKPEQRKTTLNIGGKDYCNINIEGSKVLTETFIALEKCLNKIANWEFPSFQLVYKNENGICGLMTIEDLLFVAYTENEEQKMEKIDGTMFGMSYNANIEEIIFILTKQIINEIKENADLWVENSVLSREDHLEEELEARKDRFKQAMLRVVDSLEETEKEAEKKYRIPEYVKGRTLFLKHCQKLNFKEK